jgi:hypothetical protein
MNKIPFTFSLEITPDISIDFDCEAEIDPGEAQSQDCPGSDACVDHVYVKYGGIDCAKTLDEMIMEMIYEQAENELAEYDGDEP